MSASQMLQSLREKGYGDSGGDTPDDPSGREIELTEEEAATLTGSQDKDVTLQVTGRLMGNVFAVTSVSGGESKDEMAKQMMEGSLGGQPLMVQNKTMPSPS